MDRFDEMARAWWDAQCIGPLGAPCLEENLPKMGVAEMLRKLAADERAAGIGMAARVASITSCKCGDCMVCDIRSDILALSSTDPIAEARRKALKEVDALIVDSIGGYNPGANERLMKLRAEVRALAGLCPRTP